MGAQQVHVAIYEGLADWEAGYLTTALNDSQYQAGPEPFEVVTVGETAARVTTMGGLTVVPERTVDGLTPEESAMLVLPGAPGWDAHTMNADLWTGLVRDFLAAGRPVAAICGATFGLADAGLLDDRDHTSGAPQYLEAAAGYDGATHYREADAVNDGDGLITAGPTEPIAFAREAIRELGAFTDDVLEAWAGLHATSDPKHFFALHQLTSA